MQHIQENTTTLFTPDFESDEEMYHFTERLLEGLPGRSGNALLLLKLGIPTPSAELALPRALRERLSVQLYLDAEPGKDFVRHEQPGVDVQETVADTSSGAGGPVYRLRVSRLPVPQKHQVFDRVGL